jgi:hypothetical protein
MRSAASRQHRVASRRGRKSSRPGREAKAPWKGRHDRAHRPVFGAYPHDLRHRAVAAPSRVPRPAQEPAPEVQVAKASRPRARAPPTWTRGTETCWLRRTVLGTAATATTTTATRCCGHAAADPARQGRVQGAGRGQTLDGAGLGGDRTRPEALTTGAASTPPNVRSLRCAPSSRKRFGLRWWPSTASRSERAFGPCTACRPPRLHPGRVQAPKAAPVTPSGESGGHGRAIERARPVPPR